MTTAEQNYDTGYGIGKHYCKTHGLTQQETYKVPCPAQWPESMENGFFDAIADYRRSLAK